MRSSIGAFGLAVVLAAGCAASNHCETIAIASHPPLVWSVAGDDGAIVVFATHQAASSDDIPRAAWSALDASDLYVAEAEEVSAGSEFGARRGWRDALELPEGRSLQEILSADDFDRLDARIDGDVKRMKPWVAMFLLARTVFTFPSPSINEALLDRAHQRRIETAFLDTWEDQVRYLDAAVGGGKLTQAIRDYDRMGCRLERSAAMYRAGADEAFANDIASADEPVVTRIHHWLGSLQSLLASRHHAFVAIGIGELVGPYGLLVELERRGYRVQRFTGR